MPLFYEWKWAYLDILSTSQRPFKTSGPWRITPTISTQLHAMTHATFHFDKKNMMNDPKMIKRENQGYFMCNLISALFSRFWSILNGTLHRCVSSYQPNYEKLVKRQRHKAVINHFRFFTWNHATVNFFRLECLI